jgi:hydroxypyruvate isomerase
VLKFSANVSLLFPDVPLVERFARAAAAGFDTVEMWWPSGEDLDAVEAAVHAAHVRVDVLNFDAGDMPAGDRGLLSDPAREPQFRANVPVALEFAQRLGCSKLNALVGVQLDHIGRRRQLEIARANVVYAAQGAAAQAAEILIEAVNTFENGRYLLAKTSDAAQFVADVGEPNVALQYDAYHMTVMGEDVLVSLERHFDRVGHVQIADAPGRGEPGSGEIDYPALFRLLGRLGYDGHLGLEYKPTTERTEDSFGWIAQVAAV